MAKISESLQRAQANYQDKCKVITIRFNKETEPELVEWLKKNPGTASTKIKQMIRDQIGQKDSLR